MPSTFADIPTIDVSPLFGSDPDAKKEVAKQIDLACRGSGFFYASNHGIDVEALVDVTTTFHRTISNEEKKRIAIHAYNKENTKQIRNGYSLPVEGKKPQENFCFLNPEFSEHHSAVRDGLPGHEVNVWPDEASHPGFREFQEGYYRAVLDLSKKLLCSFALALGKEESFFDRYITEYGTLSSVVLIRYPYLEDYPPRPVAEDGTKLSFGSHRDISMITVLYQSDVQNLQVETPEGFKDIPASADCFLVNAGSHMDYITDGYYKTPLHRVKFVNEERLSLPFFANLDYSATIEPFIPHEENKKPNNKALTFGCYLEGELLALIKSNGQT